MGTIIGQTIEGKTVTKGMVTEIRTVADPGIEIEIGGIGVAPESSQSRSSSRSQNRYENRRQGSDYTRNRDRSESRSRSSFHVSTNRDRSRCYRCNK